MDTFRFGRKLSLPSTIAIKHQVRMLMADDRAKKAKEEARVELTDIPQMSVGKASALTVVFFVVLFALATAQLRAWRARGSGAS